MGSRDVTGKCAVKKFNEFYMEWNYNMMGGENSRSPPLA
jgi:hypothetical protein